MFSTEHLTGTIDMAYSILLIHPHDVWYDPWCTRIVEIACALKNAGHTPTVAYFDSGKEPHCRVSLPNDVEFISLSRAKKDYRNNIAIIRDKAREAKIIHVQKCWPNACIPACWAAYLEDKPLHYDWDDLETELVRAWKGDGTETSVISHWERTMVKLADTVSVASRSLREIALNAGLPNSKIFDAPVGANLDVFNPEIDGTEARTSLGIAANDPLVLYSGQLNVGAYAELFVMAAGTVLQDMPNTQFAVVGSGDSATAARELAEEKGMSIHFTGMVPHEDVPKYLAAADIGVATFEDNAIVRAKSPLKIAEYMASGLPIVASDVGEVSRMVGDAGILVPPGNGQAVGENILRLLQDRNRMMQLGKMARQRAESIYNWDKTADNLIRAYEKAISPDRNGSV